MKYIDAELLRKEIEEERKSIEGLFIEGDNNFYDGQDDAYNHTLALIDSLQQEQDLIVINKKDWEAQEQFRKNKDFGKPLQQEQPNDICAEIKEYYGEEPAFEDERTKAAYHFFSAGKAFELREYEEEREKHITDLLDNFQKGMNAGYEKAISELKNKEFLNESEQVFVDLVTERMLREGPIPTLKGKQKAEFEKEFNRFKQITGMINFPAHMEIYKEVILWFMAWGADNLPNLNKVTDPDKLDFQQEQPSDYLEEAAIDFADNARKQLYSKDYAISSIADYDHGCIDGFKAGAEWMKRKMMEGAANAYILKSYNPVTEQGEPTLHAIEIELVYEDEGKPYLIAGQRARIIILPKEEK